MEMSTIEVLNNGMQCLIENMGIIGAEQFISAIIREKFDYTKWQRNYFDSIPAEELHRSAVKYEEEHPYKGSGKIISVKKS